MRFRPCIDIHNGKVKQIVGSTLNDGADPVTNFESVLPPSHFAGMYRKNKLYGGHVIMLGKGNDAAAIDALRAFPGGLQAGGGIAPENAAIFLDAGASHVIVTSYVFREGALQWDRLAAMGRAVGRERLVLDLSCIKRGGSYIVVTDRWRNETDVTLSRQLFGQLGDRCDEFLIHAAHVEGMRGGIDAELIQLLSDCAQQPITYAGGVRSIDDLELVAAAGRERIDVTVGSALDLFGGGLAYRKVVEWFGERGRKKAEG
ncbi:MAG: phosphoribosylformimino-5-aminoimidazole carboxamide ribotide isomerase [Chitinispirillaceae bacterium]|nr:phosphoribosylformimino-5-aminoimidazole carboxamide ribotide isomerase [Chitinispirillaceae bacterium]